MGSQQSASPRAHQLALRVVQRDSGVAARCHAHPAAIRCPPHGLQAAHGGPHDVASGQRRPALCASCCAEENDSERRFPAVGSYLGSAAAASLQQACRRLQLCRAMTPREVHAARCCPQLLMSVLVTWSASCSGHTCPLPWPEAGHIRGQLCTCVSSRGDVLPAARACTLPCQHAHLRDLLAVQEGCPSCECWCQAACELAPEKAPVRHSSLSSSALAAW